MTPNTPDKRITLRATDDPTSCDVPDCRERGDKITPEGFLCGEHAAGVAREWRAGR